ncbi:MAG: TRAP transporter small permease [Desulfopila sp.]
MARLVQGFHWLSKKLMQLGAVLLLAMVALTCIDVVGRLFGHPVFGAYELMSFMAALVATAALPDTHTEKRHIGVEIVTNKLGKRTNRFLQLGTGILACAIIGIAAWQLVLLARNVRLSGEVSMNLGAPEYMVIAAVAVGFVLFFFSILFSLREIVGKLSKR